MLKNLVARMVETIQAYPALSAGLIQVVITVAALRGIHLSPGDAAMFLSMVAALLMSWVHGGTMSRKPRKPRS